METKHEISQRHENVVSAMRAYHAGSKVEFTGNYPIAMKLYEKANKLNPNNKPYIEALRGVKKVLRRQDREYYHMWE